MKDIAVNIVLYTVEMFIAFMYGNSIFNKKHKTYVVLLISEALYIIIFAFNTLLNNLFINLISFFIINILVFLINYEITFRQSIVHSIVLTAVMFTSECIVVFLLPPILNIDFSTYQNDFWIMIIESSLSKILYTFFCFILTKNKKFHTGSKYSKPPLYLFIFPVCSMFMLVILIIVSMKFELPSTISITISFFSVILLLATVITYVLQDNYSKKEIELLELRNELSKEETNKAYYQILERQNDEMHSFSHNTKNHFQVIKSLTNEKKVEDYIDKCYEKLEKYSMFGKSNNKILDIIINKYSLLCEIKHIDFFVSIKTANLLYIKDDELSTLLNCILDNAVEATEKVENGKKRIEFDLNNQNYFDVLTCINSCNYNPDFDKKVLKTTKENADMHGYGTKSIKKIVKNNKGTYSWKYDKENNEFVTTIIFKKES